MKKFSVTNSNNNWIRDLLSADFNKAAVLTSHSSEQNYFAEIKWHRMELALKVAHWQNFGLAWGWIIWTSKQSFEIQNAILYNILCK